MKLPLLNIKKSLNDNVPNHVAFIMDGNGRWAQKRGLPRKFGHSEGAKRLKEIVKEAGEIGVKVITVFAFSTENWSRPKEEIDHIFSLIKNYLVSSENEFVHYGVKVTFIGDLSVLNKDLLQGIEQVIEKTKNNKKVILNIAFNYGSKEEILRAIKKIAQDYKNNKIEMEMLNYDMIDKYLMTKDLPKVDLVIRTSGEKRLSNFLLWQIAYSEIIFTPTLWPDYNKKEFIKSIIEYQSRDRRYGGIKK